MKHNYYVIGIIHIKETDKLHRVLYATEINASNIQNKTFKLDFYSQSEKSFDTVNDLIDDVKNFHIPLLDTVHYCFDNCFYYNTTDEPKNGIEITNNQLVNMKTIKQLIGESK